MAKEVAAPSEASNWQERLLALLASPAPPRVEPSPPRFRGARADSSSDEEHDERTSDSDGVASGPVGGGERGEVSAWVQRREAYLRSRGQSVYTGAMDNAMRSFSWAVGSTGHGGSIALLALRRWRMPLLWKVLSSWRHARNLRVSRLLTATHRWRRGRVGAALRTWAGQAAAANAQLAAMRSAICSLRAPVLGGAFRAWLLFRATVHGNLERIRLVLVRLQRQAQHACFAQWRSRVTSARERGGASAGASVRQLGRTKLACIRRWRVLAARGMARDRACDVHAARVRVVSSFYAWEAVMHATTLLRACSPARGRQLLLRPPSAAKIRAAGVNPEPILGGGRESSPAARLWMGSERSRALRSPPPPQPSAWRAHSAEAREYDRYLEIIGSQPSLSPSPLRGRLTPLYVQSLGNGSAPAGQLTNGAYDGW